MSKQQFFVNKPNKLRQESMVTEEEMMERERREKAGLRNFVIFVVILILAVIVSILFNNSLPN